MSATEWKFVPVEPTREMLVAALKTNGACPIYAAMLDAAPVPPSVESQLENWTPSDQQAFAKFRDEHFPGEMSSYAIQSLGSAWKDGQANADPTADPVSARMTVRDRIEWMSKNDPDLWADWMGDSGLTDDLLDQWMTENGVPTHKASVPSQPAAHLTIPGALEWDGDNGTHGADGESRADSESSEIERLRALSVTNILMAVTPGFDGMGCEHYAQSVGEVEQKLGELSDQVEDLSAQLANTEQSRRSFFDLSQDLEKRLAERDALLRAVRMNSKELLAAWVPSDWEAKRQIVLSAITKPAKTKTCIECDQPYCHGVCVERSDQDYDRDQAAKGGDDE